MPRISFGFYGWVRGANITTVYDIKLGKDVDVSDVPGKTVVENLENGTWSISLTDSLSDNVSSEVEIFDYAE
ncbi:MAG: hypothetical protein WC390_10095 [Sulfurimonas sp.]|jgi:hypothetical protein